MASKKYMTKKRKLKSLTIALISVYVFDVIFIGIMIYLFNQYQSVPDTLILSVFGATIGETSACAIIKNKKLELDGKLDLEREGEPHGMVD